MSSILRRIIDRIRVSLFPSPHDIELRRWYAADDNEGLRYNYDLNANSIVVDLGGYKGQWASDIYARFNCRILVFEPVRSFVESIEKRFEKNPQIEVFPFALGARKRTEVISLNADGSSVFKGSGETELVQFEDAVEFLASHDIGRIDLLKINTEGGEYEFLPKLIDSGLVKNTRHIQIQFHDIARDSVERMNEICARLEETHFPTYRFRFVWENWSLREALGSEPYVEAVFPSK